MKHIGVVLLVHGLVSVSLSGRAAKTGSQEILYGNWIPIPSSDFSHRAGYNLDLIDEIHGPGFSPGPNAKYFGPKRRGGKKIYAANDFRLKRNPGSLLPRPPKSKLTKDDFDYFDFQNWEPMSLREYEESLKKVKRNNKVTKNNLAITVPSLHLNPPKFTHDSIPIQESLISLRPTNDTNVMKRQIPKTTPSSSSLTEEGLNHPKFNDSIPIQESLFSLRPTNDTNVMKRQIPKTKPSSSIRTVTEEGFTKIKKTTNKVYVDKLPITVPSLHLKPPKYEPNQIPSKESSMRYKKQTSSTKSTMSKAEPSSEGILTYPKRFLTPPKQVPASESKSQETILKNPISIPINRQGTFVGQFKVANTKSKNQLRRKGTKPPLPPKPFGPPQQSSSPTLSEIPPLQSLFSSANFSPTKKSLPSFTYKKAVPEPKAPTKSSFPKDVFKKHKRKSTKSMSIPLAELLFAPEDLANEFAAIKKRKASQTSKTKQLVVDNFQNLSVNSASKNDPSANFSEMMDREFQYEANRPVRNLATYASLPSYNPSINEKSDGEDPHISYSPKIISNEAVERQTNTIKYSPKPTKKVKEGQSVNKSYSPKPSTKAVKKQSGTGSNFSKSSAKAVKKESRIVNYSPAPTDVAEERQGSVGPQIPIVSQTQEMNQDPSQSFSFDFVTGNGISRSETGSLQNSGQQQRGQWEYTAPNGEELPLHARRKRNSGYHKRHKGHTFSLGLENVQFKGPRNVQIGGLRNPSFRLFDRPHIKGPRDIQFKALRNPSFRVLTDPSFSALTNPSIKGPTDIQFKGPRNPNYSVFTDPSFRVLTNPSIRGPTDLTIKGPRNPSFRLLTDPSFRVLTDPSIRGPTDLQIKGPRNPSFSLLTDPSFSVLTNPSIKGPTHLKIGSHSSKYHK